MAKDNQIKEISNAVEGQIKDIQNVDGRLNTLNTNISKDAPIIQQHLQSEEYIISTLEGLAGKTISEIVSNDKIKVLVDNLHDNLKQNINLKPEDKEKMKYNIARTEAVLKGFALPLVKSGPLDELSFMGIEGGREEILANPIEAVKKALVELSGHDIPKEQYAKAVIKKSMEILQENPAKFSPEKIKQYENFITQGDKKQKFGADNEFHNKENKLSQTELTKLREATNKAVDQINERLNKNKENGAKINSFAPLLESKNEKLAKATEALLKNSDPAFLKEQTENIKSDLQKAIKTNSWEKIKATIFRQDVVGKKLEEVTKNYGLKNDNYIETEINNKIFSNALPEKQLATGLSAFVEQNKDKLQGLERITYKVGSSSEKVDSKDLVVLRKVNPAGFDKAVFEQTPSYTVPENRAEMNTSQEKILQKQLQEQTNRGTLKPPNTPASTQNTRSNRGL